MEVHGEENAICSVVTDEGRDSRFKIILIVGALEEKIMPYGRCRIAIKRYGIEGATFLCSDSEMENIERYSISDLYPEPCDEKWLFRC